MNFLEKIKDLKEKEIALLKRKVSVSDYEKRQQNSREIISLSESIKNRAGTGIIAEFKRKSPSKGLLNPYANITDVVKGYEKAGAAGISILTEEKFFGGTAGDISRVRHFTALPVLRKDFIVDEIQIYEARHCGADAILLIAALLGKKKAVELARTARNTGLEVLLEIHSPEELDMVSEHVNIIGVNNRNLSTLDVDVSTSFRLAGRMPSGFVKISESGISSPAMIKELKGAGYDGFLIGERFMSQPDPTVAFEEFVRAIEER